MMESSEACANCNNYKLEHNCCTTERDFTNLAELPHHGEDHQHDFETDSVMTTTIDKPTQIDCAGSCMKSSTEDFVTNTTR